MSRVEHASLRRKTIFGVLWVGGSQFGSQAITYVTLLLLAWLLSPADFGLSGLAMIFILFTQAVGELGLAPALVQQLNIEEPSLSTAFWANLAVSLLMAALTYANAEIVANVLGDAAATPLLKVMSVMFPITALAVVPRALLMKDLEFGRLSRRDLASQVAFGAVGIPMAAMGAGVWSLAGAAIAERVASTATFWVAVAWRPKLKFDLSALRQLLRFGFYAMIAAILARAIANIDYFVVGRWLGAEALGYYTLAFQLAIIPTQRLVSVLRRVAFPALSTVQDDLKLLQSNFLEGIHYLFAVLAPISLFLAVLAPWLIEILYGQKWLPSVGALQILAIASFFYGFDVAESLYFAVGQPKIRIGIIGLRVALFAIFAATFGLSWGITGVALSLALAVALTSFLGFIAVSRLTHTSLQTLLQPVWLSIRAALGACVPTILFGLYLAPKVNAWLILIILGLVMALIYLLGLVATYPTVFSRLRVGVQQYLRN